MDDRIYVLVTTEHRGIFAGYLPCNADRTARTLTLTNCRNVIYFAGSCGFLGLAKHGPQDGSRVGSTAPEVLLHDVTSVSVCTPEAEEKFCNWTEVTK